MTSTTDRRSTRSSATGHVVRAWRHSSTTQRFVAVSVGVVAVASSISHRVSVAAGVAAAILVAAALVDRHQRRLPNRTVALALVVFASVGVVESVVLSTPLPVAATATGCAAFAIPVLALHLASPRAMGFGDVKLSVVLGAVLGSVDWRLTLWALAIGSGASAAVALTTKQATIAFGPGLVAATIALLVLAATVSPIQVTGS